MRAENGRSSQVGLGRIRGQLDGLAIIGQRFLRLADLLLKAGAQQEIFAIAWIALYSLSGVGDGVLGSAAGGERGSSHGICPGIVGLQLQRVAYVGDGHGKIAQVEVRVTAMQEG